MKNRSLTAIFCLFSSELLSVLLLGELEKEEYKKKISEMK